jgi:hypothetical protein
VGKEWGRSGEGVGKEWGRSGVSGKAREEENCRKDECVVWESVIKLNGIWLIDTRHICTWQNYIQNTIIN